MGSGVTHIVWDWNGTIFDDGGALIGATIEAFAAAGLGQVTIELYQRLHVQPISVFYERLAGRALSAAEQRVLDAAWRTAYEGYQESLRLAADALQALTRWTKDGGTQSLLSMYTHDQLLPLVRRMGIAHHFVRIDGWVEPSPNRKAPHLREHLRRLGLSGEQVLVIGDSVDDVHAAREAGAACAVYHSGPTALHDRAHFTDLGVPVVDSLVAAVALARPAR
jgi:HAD superfamily hydrolase (TIGR01549 family)